jgi:FKBP-type peptidyl-prolyl cis-trans isomerase
MFRLEEERLKRFIAGLALMALAGCGGDNGTEPTTGGTLLTEDLVVGTGATAVNGDSVTVHYIGTLTNGQKFDSSYDRGQPIGPFRVGAGQVIPGFEQGIVGMRIGGKRRITIPPSLGYANNPPPGSGIPANSTLIFDVDLVAIAGK